MIPINLQLNNFMSYGENLESLDFTKIELACIVGANGVGKSTILEALAWSLWGKSRAKSDDDLIKQGSKEMWTDFIFLLGDGEYRVVRKKSNKSKGQSGLEFFKREGVQPKEKAWVPISGGTKVETQELIIRTLKMTYETFVNSAFLKQGRADEFTIKKPTERKKVLAQILNLSYYDKLAVKAKEASRKLMIEQESANKKLEYIESEIEDKGDLNHKAMKMKEELDKIDTQILDLENELKDQYAKKEKQDKKIDEANNLDEIVKSITIELEKLNNDIAENFDDIKKDKEYLKDEDKIKSSYKKLINLRRSDQRSEELLKIKARILQDKSETEKSILSSKGEVLQRKSNLEYRLKTINDNIKNKDIFEQKYFVIKKNLVKLNKIEESKLLLERKIKLISDKISFEIIKLKQIEIKGKELKEKIIELESARGSDCPLCKQDLSSEYRSNVIKDLDNIKAKEAVRYANTKGVIKKLKENNNILNIKMDKYLKEIQIKPKLEGELVIVKNKLEEINKHQDEKDDIEKILHDSESKLSTGTYDKGNHHKLEEIERKIENLNYNESEHQKTKNEISELNIYESKKNKLENIKSSIKQQEKFLNKLINNKIAKEKDLKKSKDKRRNIKVDYEVIENIEKSIGEISENLNKLRGEINSKQSEVGALNEKIERVRNLEKDLKVNKKNQLKTAKEKHIVDVLVKAFGKNGIQTMIIEAAVPEIEEETNRLLSNMTDGNMSVQLKMQKEKKTDGDMIDTLDILIEDDQGIRNYEMFSGGEAYRINFAIRIALSKLLANRTGAKLQFLVIDEGFGTQDMMGRENLIQAINSISNDFKKILVITHIQELKDVFPSRIDVTKNANGSRFEVVA